MARKPAETVQLKLRFSESLRRKLERAAAQNAQSMNAEIVRRLEKSIETEDLLANVLGGPELRTYALSMIAAFAAAGRDAAAGRPAAEWLRDPECYRSAVVAVAASLVEQMKCPEQKALVLDELKMRMERQLIASGHLIRRRRLVRR